MKRCSKCGDEKEESEFHARKNGLQPWCRTCYAEYNKQRYATDPEFREYHHEHSKSAGYRAQAREYRKARLANDAAYRHYRAQMAATRYRGLAGSYTLEEWVAKLEEFNWHCALCGCDLLQLPARDVTADHVVPVSKGGPNVISNIQPACRSCNSIKGNR
jgi:5-methylcytosine-specific restriction endonuclease McrA